ncbi:MAG: hypothetical protein ACOY37_12955 [Pseudomonadota bacterium]
MLRVPDHARAALRHADAGVDHVRVLARQGRTRADRLEYQAILRELVARQRELVDMHRRIEAATPREAERLWQRFFGCYDEFLQKLDEARVEAIEDERTFARERTRERWRPGSEDILMWPGAEGRRQL